MERHSISNSTRRDERGGPRRYTAEADTPFTAYYSAAFFSVRVSPGSRLRFTLTWLQATLYPQSGLHFPTGLGRKSEEVGPKHTAVRAIGDLAANGKSERCRKDDESLRLRSSPHRSPHARLVV